eukprot:CAMPEP_0197035752 /NCGR_PEP_ID=MMETSP1384-20130603/13457_1 /TAXON_ID=29189 /ORGANISM="Ammonia sp." /LENGTH=503 /DNA_ID=CAMNT_0042465849 /DNA_START=22 /DNA_END=1533 /DNA_ORIENTATION=+
MAQQPFDGVERMIPSSNPSPSTACSSSSGSSTRSSTHSNRQYYPPATHTTLRQPSSTTPSTAATYSHHRTHNPSYPKPITSATATATTTTRTSPVSTHRSASNASSSSSSSKYLRGVVIVTPQNESTHGWIYCKSSNMMYQLPYSASKHYMVDQVVLFTASNQLRGLTLTEARSLMMQNKLNIHNYHNYFVNETTSHNICHTKLFELDEINKSYLTEDSESRHQQNKWVLNTFIDLTESSEIEFKLLPSTHSGCLPTAQMIAVMERYLNAFINVNGGTIYFGVDDMGRVCGQSLYHKNARKVLDELQLFICEKLREWKPAKYTQQLIQSVQISMIDIIKMDDKEKVGFVLPNKKIIKASIQPIFEVDVDEEEKEKEKEKESKKKQVVFSSSASNGNVVYCRQLSSLCCYRDRSMQQQIGKRQILKLNKSCLAQESDDEDCSDIDFDDDDEKDWIDVNALRPQYQSQREPPTAYSYLMPSNYFDGSYTKRISNIFQNIHNSLPI